MNELTPDSQIVSVHPGASYLARLAPGSRRAQAQALEVVAQVVSGGRETAATLPWHTLRYEQTQAVRAALVARYAPNTVNRMLTALRGTLRECWRLGTMESDAYLRAADVASLKVSDEDDVAGHALTRPELAALVAEAGTDAQGVRDRALILTMALAGLRVEEVATLTWNDANPAGLRVRGKGRRVRIVPLPTAASDALEAWRAACFGPSNEVEKQEQGRIFPLKIRAIALRLEVLSDAAGIRHVSPHDLRRTYITSLLEAGVDVLLVAKLAGHANVQTTRRYDRRELEAKRAAVRALEGLVT